MPPPKNIASGVERDSISIVVPVLNEIALIAPFLQQLRCHAADAELIVVDGGSTDGTGEAAAPWCDHVVPSAPGRARQLDAGAGAASGETLWFLHVDAEVPAHSLAAIRDVLGDARNVGGYFRIRIPHSALIYRLTDSFAHYAGHILRIRCGDHGLFCRREIFEAIGGFPQVPLMEDVEFFRALLRRGRVPAVNLRLATSARRYEEVGPAKLTLAYGLIATLYAAGVPLSFLRRIYDRTCCNSTVSSAPLWKTWRWRSNAASRSRSS